MRYVQKRIFLLMFGFEALSVMSILNNSYRGLFCGLMFHLFGINMRMQSVGMILKRTNIEVIF